MYKNNLVMSINCEGNYLQENKEGEVFIPFLSEYSIFIKNKYRKKALVSIFIDGKDVLSGKRIVINENDSVDIERFIGDSLTEGRKFKFIKKTDDIIAYKGNNPEDSLVEVRFKFEYTPKVYRNGPSIYNPDPYQYGRGPTCTLDGGEPIIKSSSVLDDSSTINEKTILKVTSHLIKPEDRILVSNSTEGIMGFNQDLFRGAFGMKANNSFIRVVKPVKIPEVDTKNISEEGITVKGSLSLQEFKQTFHVETEYEEYSMIIKLKGRSNKDSEIIEPITKKSKKVCTSCGKKWPYDYTYCPHDTTFLEDE